MIGLNFCVLFCFCFFCWSKKCCANKRLVEKKNEYI